MISAPGNCLVLQAEVSDLLMKGATSIVSPEVAEEVILLLLPGS